MIKTIGIGLLGLLCLVGWSGSAFSADDTVVEFEVPAGERQLFLDDVGIASIRNLTRTMHQPEKKGAVIPCDPGRAGPDQHSLHIHTPPIWDPDEQIWKCWTTVPR